MGTFTFHTNPLHFRPDLPFYSLLCPSLFSYPTNTHTYTTPPPLNLLYCDICVFSVFLFSLRDTRIALVLFCVCRDDIRLRSVLPFHLPPAFCSVPVFICDCVPIKHRSGVAIQEGAHKWRPEQLALKCESGQPNQIFVMTACTRGCKELSLLLAEWS
jgi:hypothetical protein